MHDIWRSKRRLAIASAAAVLALILSACSGPSGQNPQASGDPYTGSLTYWFWGESDVPGSTNWMQAAVSRYEALHPGIHIQVVPQATQTLQGAFQTAAQAKTGPDIAMQWATLPVLTPAWRGQITPLTGLIPESELSQWPNTQENTYDGKVWAMPLYLLGVPFVWNKDLFAKAGLDSTHGPQTWDELWQTVRSSRQPASPQLWRVTRTAPSARGSSLWWVPRPSIPSKSCKRCTPARRTSPIRNTRAISPG